MKSLIFTLITVSASLASAVSTKNCPAELSISYGKMTAMTPAQLERELQFTFVDLEDLQPSVDALKAAQPNDYRFMIYTLQAKVNSQCRYAPLDEKLGSINETRLITRNGRDILRVAMRLGNEIVWVYHDVVSYSSEHIEVSKTSGKVLGYMDHGAAVAGVGWANDLEIDAR